MGENTGVETATETGSGMTGEHAEESFQLDMDSYVNVELGVENNVVIVDGQNANAATGELLNREEDEGLEDDDDDSGTDHFGTVILPEGTRLQRVERQGRGQASHSLPDTFQTNHLLYYERFKAYQDYMLGDCKPSEVKAFTAEYLEKVVEPSDWQALWCTDVFDVLVEVQDVEYKDLKACVSLVLPLQCEARGCELDEEAMKALLEATRHKVALQELQVVYEETGDFDETALAIEHLRFFYQHIWRKWDEEDDDDDFDYFVRCVEPRLRLYYDILEDRVPAGLVAEYQSLLVLCSQCFGQFSQLRSGLSSDSESELDNVSMVEGLKLYVQLETLQRKLRIIENPLLRYVLGYRGNTRQQCVQARGSRPSGIRVVHVVSASTTASQLQSLVNDRLLPLCSADDTEVQFHSDPVLAVGSCYEDDTVIVLPGHYSVTNSIFLPDSITVEGFGPPDEVVIEKKNKGDSFVQSTGAAVKISNIKFIQHDAIEGILCVRQGNLQMENCVLQCETTGVILRTSAQLTMTMCDLYGSKGAGVEIYPGSVCSLMGNGIHHCKDGILIKDFADEKDVMPSITMENNVIHNNEGYGVILVKPNPKDQDPQDNTAETPPGPAEEEGGQREEKQEGGVTPEEGDVAASSTRKWRLCRQLSRTKDTPISRTVEGPVDQHMFVSIQGNQFRRNGMGDFGTFFY